MVKKAVILAAGIGKRLLPSTIEKPKVMIKVGNKPVVSYIVEKLKKIGIKEIAFVVGYKKEMIKNYFGNFFTYIEQEKPLGTAHAIKVAKEFVGDENFIVVNGDIFFTDDLKSFIKNTPITLAIYKVENASRFGRILISKGFVKDILEKNGKPIHDFVNAGIYIFNKKIFDVIEKTPLSKRNEYEITDSLKILLKEGLNIKYYVLKGYWKDIGKIEDLEEVKNFVLHSFNSLNSKQF